MKNKLNDDGITLVELLVSITLISIVIIYFLGFFGQSMKLSIKVENKLSSINIAEKVLSDVKNNAICNDKEETLNGKIYFAVVSCLGTTPKEQTLGLTRVHVKIYTSKKTSGIKPISEVYGYIESGG